MVVPSTVLLSEDGNDFWNALIRKEGLLVGLNKDATFGFDLLDKYLASALIQRISSNAFMLESKEYSASSDPLPSLVLLMQRE